MILTKETQQALIVHYFPNGFTLKEAKTFIDGLCIGIEMNQIHLKNRENENNGSKKQIKILAKTPKL